MKFSSVFVLSTATLALAVNAARADIVVGTGGWQSYTAADLNEGGTPFWDNKSLDGPHQGVGYQLLPATPNYYGNNDGTAVLNESFSRGASAGSISGNLLLAISAYDTQNQVGWYDTTNPTVMHTIWTGSDSPSSGASQAFDPSASWGLYLIAPDGTFYSDAALNSPNDGSQHFAIFQLSTTTGAEEYEIGIEDQPNSPTNYEGIGDFNDFVFTIQTQPGDNPFTTGSGVPEPASLSVLGLGVAGMLLRRRKAK